MHYLIENRGSSGGADPFAPPVPPGTPIDIYLDGPEKLPRGYSYGAIPPGGNCGLAESAKTNDIVITDESLVRRRYYHSY